MATNADCRICHRTIRGFDDICLSCWTGIENAEPGDNGCNHATDDACTMAGCYRRVGAVQWIIKQAA